MNTNVGSVGLMLAFRNEVVGFRIKTEVPIEPKPA